MQIAWFNFLKYLAYPTEFTATVLAVFIKLAMTTFLWSIVAQSGGLNQTPQQLLIYFFLINGVTGLIGFSPFSLAATVIKLVKDGSLSHYLLQPLGVVFYLNAYTIGHKGIERLVGLLSVVAGIVMLQPGLVQLGWFSLFLVIAFALSFGINVLIGSMAFVTIDASGFRAAMEHVFHFASGKNLPLTIFAGPILAAMHWLPFVYLGFVPISILQNTVTDQGSLGMFAVTGAFWAVAVNIVAYVAWHRGLRKYEAVGL